MRADDRGWAGLLIVNPDGQVLLARRSARVSSPGLWAIPGGGIEPGEDVYEAALREAEEELGGVPPFAVERVYHERNGRSQTLVVRLVGPAAEVWEPDLNDENDAWDWFPPGLPPEPLHPHAERALREVRAWL